MNYILIILISVITFTVNAEVSCADKELSYYYEKIEKLTSREEDIDRQYKIGNNNFIKRELYDKLTSLYDSCFKGYIQTINLKKLNSKQLHKLFTTVKKVNFYIPNNDLINSLKIILHEKDQRGEHIENLLTNIYRSHIKLRQFQQAKDFATIYPNIEFSYLPKDIKTAQFTNEKTTFHLINKDESFSLIQREVMLKTKNYIVIISSPICSPSNRFLSWLHKDENQAIKNALIPNTLFMSPPASSIFISEWTAVQKKYSDVNMQLSHKKSDWPDIQSWATPTMYFYKDGKLFNQLVGWPDEGRKEELKEAMQDIGLLN
ncbi:hypothetical protein [uncultured Psychrosphaera sp.]|uniref:hypothetical protein n=1 Tax=uncultured Psychrosphaera sp. TaxID=1403522 RepID=UPI00261E2482|nr:hypothetical protein [uncultured Psychrosphaera sp.]